MGHDHDSAEPEVPVHFPTWTDDALHHLQLHSTSTRFFKLRTVETVGHWKSIVMVPDHFPSQAAWFMLVDITVKAHSHAACCVRPASLLPLLLPRLVVLRVRPLEARLGISPLGRTPSVPSPDISCSSSRAGKLSLGWFSSSCKQ